MKKFLIVFCCCLFSLVIISCSNCKQKSDIELMGAGDRIHDSFTFANIGVDIKEESKNNYIVSGAVEELNDNEVKNEFDIASDVAHVVAIKLSANGRAVLKDKINITIDGVRSYDAEHLNGSDYTFIILEAVKSKNVAITVSWNGVDKENYIIQFSDNLVLK